MDSTRIRLDESRTKMTPSRELLAPVPASGPAAGGAREAREGRGIRWGRLVRWGVGLAILAEAGWLATPTVLYRTSVRATVTAPVVAVRVSHEGEVVGTPPAVGERVSAGQVLFELQMAVPDRRPAERLRGEIESARKSSAALEAQVARLDEVKRELGKHFSDYREVREAQAQRQAAEQAARVQSAEARLKTAEFEVAMQRRLSGKGVSSGVDLARAENALVEARTELEVARQSAARHQLQLEAARKGLFVGEADGGQDRVASRQRCDEIEIQQAGLRERRDELEAQIREMEARLASEDRHLAATRIPVRSPIGGVVWSSPLAAGSEISPGWTALEVVDPARLRVEALFRDADAQRIRPGLPVKVRLPGSEGVLDGHVARVSAPGPAEVEPVAGRPDGSAYPGTFRATVALDRQPDGGERAEAYVGGSAVVWAAR
ncbi:multidrug resistance protein MdtN [Aquisphaera giovannonii]|uniref:Multidrug resistance protein MdtN n=1 Tax=Aquisphaera giovannonii TaxID=406548 RepID=A0A5B9WD17_9BACT|nr:HlyD family efflux transporter periplasmic adaptor subunit [Aquisphaera giovannonii]QEH38383.1 multidrug resistance protein MdtN [Aquisphaera giovannonii]